MTGQASRSCATSSATVLRARSSSDSTVTSAPLPAPRVMIMSAEPASTGSPPSYDSVTGTPDLTTASAMIAAGLACRPMAEPTMTVLADMGSPWGCWGLGEGYADAKAALASASALGLMNCLA